MASGAHAQVMFEDVAIYFSSVEWAELAEWQKDLYRAVMVDNYEAVTSLDQRFTRLVPAEEHQKRPKRAHLVCHPVLTVAEPNASVENLRAGPDCNNSNPPHLPFFPH